MGSSCGSSSTIGTMGMESGKSSKYGDGSGVSSGDGR